MDSRINSRFCNIGLALSLGAAFMPGVVHAVSATWTAGSGNYSDAANWDVPVAPCNTGATLFQVTIPADTGVVSDDVALCDVDTFNLGDNSEFRILGANDYTVSGQAELFGIVHGAGGDFTASSAVFPGNRARAHVEQGASIVIGAVDYSSAGLPGAFTLFSATNPGSVLDLSSLQNMDASFDDADGAIRMHTVTTSDHGTIDLSGLASVTAPARNEDRLQFEIADATGAILLPRLAILNGAGQTLFDLSGGASLSLPSLTSVNNGSFSVFGGSSLTANGPLWDYSSAGLTRSAFLINASNPGSLLDLSSMQSLDAGFNDVNGNVRAQTVMASDGAVIDLSGLISVTAPARVEDRLDFVLPHSNGTILLSSLSNIDGVGQTVFNVFGGGSQLLPSLSNVNNARFRVRGASSLTASGPLWDYSSAGLRGDFYLFLAADPGSVLDLQSLQKLDAGFDDADDTVRTHWVTASGGGSIDLSGLASVTAPARVEDRLTFDLADATSTIVLSSLSTMGGGGQTLFSLIGGSSQSLPSLSSVNNARFFVNGASTLTANGPPWDYSSAGLSGDFTLFSSTDPGSVLDLSSLRTLHAGFNDATGNRRHQVVAADGARIDLSGLVSVTAPARAEDLLEFFVAANGTMDVSGLSSITGGGHVAFVVARGGEIRLGDLGRAKARTSIYLDPPEASLVAPASLLLQSAGAAVSPVSLQASVGSSVSIGQDFTFDHTDESRIYLESAIVQLDGAGTQFVEAGGFDTGTATPLSANFGFGQMIVGSDDRATTVYLRDGIDNGNGHVLCGPGEEALYLLGLQQDPANPGKIINGLRILGGSTLVLNGIPLYTTQDGVLVDVRTWFPPGQSVIAYALNNSNGFIALGSSPETDADADGVFDKDDNCVVMANGPDVPFPWPNPAIDPNQRDTNGDGYGNLCDPDLDDNGVVQAADLAVLKQRFFTADPDADLDGNGFVAGADLAVMKRTFFQPPGPSCVAP